jgi:hypothetical protein
MNYLVKQEENKFIYFDERKNSALKVGTGFLLVNDNDQN